MSVHAYKNPNQFDLLNQIETPSFFSEKKRDFSFSEQTQEIIESEKCPDCDEIALFGGVCNACGYMENPDLDIDITQYIHENINKNKTHFTKEHFDHGAFKAYAVKIDKDQKKVTEIVARVGKRTFLFHVGNYEWDMCSFQSEMHCHIDLDHKKISFQYGNTKKTLGKLYYLINPNILHNFPEIMKIASDTVMYKEVVSFVHDFLKYYHLNH